ncbi:hypothetical protein HOLleu_27413 [Holothuria leucospilota]|uniref:Uncharacterized protein n=1 Tax=Holothuria leucospilota TaxID=206669 RepID=A0A9Q1BPW7_HOLLE|nr:hypothetical protein HOLleu_27413 [Holothuria leucospilota]
MQPGNRQFSSYCGASSHERLWGASVRVSMGAAQIITGFLEFAFGLVLIAIPGNYFDIGPGIWCGVFAILTGLCGAASRKNKCLVIAYMVLSIITAVMCGCCFIVTAFSARTSHYYMVSL